MGTPLVVAKARAFPFSYELIEVMVSVLKVVAFRVATVVVRHALEVS